MNLKELLEKLGIDGPDEFAYFETFADMIEMDGEIPPETLFKLVSQAPVDVVGKLVEHYFDDILDNLPEDEIELYTMMETIKMSLSGFGKYAREERNLVTFADELYRFRNWYRFESKVYCDVPGEGEQDVMPLFDAIVQYRSDKLDNQNLDDFSYDFSECLSYPLDEYVVSFSDYARKVSGDSDDNDEEDEE